MARLPASSTAGTDAMAPARTVRAGQIKMECIAKASCRFQLSENIHLECNRGSKGLFGGKVLILMAM
jgi:hypothetical protein